MRNPRRVFTPKIVSSKGVDIVVHQTSSLRRLLTKLQSAQAEPTAAPKEVTAQFVGEEGRARFTLSNHAMDPRNLPKDGFVGKRTHEPPEILIRWAGARLGGALRKGGAAAVSSSGFCLVCNDEDRAIGRGEELSLHKPELCGKLYMC